MASAKLLFVSSPLILQFTSASSFGLHRAMYCRMPGPSGGISPRTFFPRHFAREFPRLSNMRFCDKLEQTGKAQACEMHARTVLHCISQPDDFPGLPQCQPGPRQRVWELPASCLALSHKGLSRLRALPDRSSPATGSGMAWGKPAMLVQHAQASLQVCKRERHLLNFCSTSKSRCFRSPASPAVRWRWRGLRP